MRITAAHLGEPVRYESSHGDLWTSTWADDGAMYVASDDTTGFEGACSSSNLAISRIDGEAPPDVYGTTMNCMEDYGAGSEFLQEDGGMWKANGLTCIGGVLYLAVSRHGNNEAGPFYWQKTWDASIVASRDKGKTWTASPLLGRAMFPGHTFSTPFFVEYGQDGHAGPHGSDTYVYAISNDGSWNNGNSMTLGRVQRERIGRLDPADWEFVQRLDNDGQPCWGPRHDIAGPVFHSPGRASMTGLHYIAPLGLYVLPQWHYTRLDEPDRCRRWIATRWELYQAPTPWGPWHRFHTRDWEPEGFYNPSIPSKFISPDGRSLWFLTAGEYATGAYYALYMIPATLEVEEE